MFGVIKPHLKDANPAKFKSTPCKFFLQGTCTRGAECTWSHGEADAGMGMGMDMSSMMGMGMGMGKGMGKSKGGGMAVATQALSSGAGDGAVANYKKTICKFFMQGKCAKGAECTFSHGENGELGDVSALMGGGGGEMAPEGGKPSNFRKTPCKFFAMGMCKNGAACTFAHTPVGGKGAWGGGKGKGWGSMMGMMDPWSMLGMGKMGGLKGMMVSAFGKGKGKSSGKMGKGHLLPRTRISEAPFTGTVVEWKGKFGWIQPAETIDHPKAAKHNGRLFFSIDDAGPQGIPEGTTVTFHIWEDASGLGADEINQV